MNQNIKVSISQFEKLESLVELAQTLGQQKDFNEILRLVTQLSARLLHAKIALILLVNPRTQKTVKTVFREGQRSSQQKYRVAQDLISGWVMKYNRSFVSKNIQKDERIEDTDLSQQKIKSVMCVPFESENSTLGTLLLMNDEEGKTFTEHDLAYLKKIAAISAPYISNVQRIQEYFEPPLSEVTLLRKYREKGLLGKSDQFIELLKAIESCARCDVRVLLEGQSGTGKELIAKAIHQFSARSSQSFVAIDCGAIPENLIESELFGHVKGAFTGAQSDRTGLIAEANNGTMFMDEIANLPLTLQSKLMRFLQEGEVRPLGSNKSRNVNVRIITASSKSLNQMVASGQFREDLFYRLHVYPIFIPPLKERQEDIPILANHFLELFAKQQNKQVNLFSKELLDFLKQRDWLGNIRELENFIERLVTVTNPDVVTIKSKILPLDLKMEFEQFKANHSTFNESLPLKENLQVHEADLIKRALDECGWNQSQAARMLRISERNIRFRMEKLNITKRPDIDP